MKRNAPRLLSSLAGLSLFLLPSVARAQGETGFLRGRGKLDLVLGFTEDR